MLCSALYQQAATRSSIWAWSCVYLSANSAPTISDSISMVKVVRRRARPGVRGDVVRVSSSVNLQNHNY